MNTERQLDITINVLSGLANATQAAANALDARGNNLLGQQRSAHLREIAQSITACRDAMLELTKASQPHQTQTTHA